MPPGEGILGRRLGRATTMRVLKGTSNISEQTQGPSKQQQQHFDVHVSVSRCAFLDNTIWPYSGSTVEGLVELRRSKMDVLDSIFVGTKKDPTETVCSR